MSQSDGVAGDHDTSRPGTLSKSLRETLRPLSVLFLVVAAFSGKADLSRFLAFLGPVGDTEIRAFALVLCVLAIGVDLALTRRPASEYRSRLFVALLVSGPWLALTFFSMYASLHLWQPGAQYQFIADLFYIAVMTFVAVFLFREKRQLVLAATAIETISIAVFLGSMFTIGPDESAYNYGEVATTITNYRIFGAGICAALFLCLQQRGALSWRMLHAFLAVFFVFACLASTAKTGLIAVSAIGLTVLVVTAVAGRWREQIAFALIVALGVGVFALNPSSAVLVSRIQSVSSVPAPIADEVREKTSPCNPQFTVNTPPELVVRDDSCTEFATVPDPTQRIRLALHALEIFNSSPVWGAGPNGFMLLLAQPGYEASIYTYPHNLILDVAFKTGILGLGLVSLSLIIGLIVVVRAIHVNFSVLYLACIPILYLAGSLTGGDIYDARVAWVIFAMIGGVYGLSRSGRLSETP